jgi:hypothetical protein
MYLHLFVQFLEVFKPSTSKFPTSDLGPVRGVYLGKYRFPTTGGNISQRHLGEKMKRRKRNKKCEGKTRTDKR